MSHYSKKPAKTLLFMAMFAASAFPSTAAPAEDTSVLEEVFVTGSYIRGAAQDAASPVDIIDLDFIQRSGAVSIADLINKLAVNSGSENQADSFTAGGTQGTSNINLRGLGLSSTLVLINGKRQTIAGALANDGSVFVDTSTIPFVALERIEVLKEGAASTYGSDAVAGVVNFILRKDFDGFEISTGLETTDEDNADTKDISVLWGAGNDTTHVTLAASYLEQDPISVADRPRIGTQLVSSFGRSFVLTAPATVTDGPYAGTYGAGQSVADPACIENGGLIAPQPFGERCGFFFGPRFNIVNEEERTQLYGNLTHEINDDLMLTVELGYSKTEVLDNPQSPSYPSLNFPVVPANSVDNPFGVPVVFIGRPLGSDFPSPLAPRESETIRAVAGLEGIFDNDFSWNFDITYSENEANGSNPDNIASRFADAINGIGGASGTETFNLFASTNSPELIAFITTNQVTDTTTELLVIDFVTSGEIGQVGIAPVGVAFGAQYRRDGYKVERNAVSTVTFEADGTRIPADLTFLGGGSEIDEDRDAYAVFAEAQFTLTEELTVNVAARYEDLDSDSTIDPKLSVRYQPLETLIFRGSVSTSFRESSLTQQFAEGTSLNPIVDPNNGSFAFVKTTAQGNVDLSPEEATNYNFGIIFQPTDSLDIKLDYWRVDYQDLITVETAQAKINADPNGADIIRTATGDLQGINVNFFNASSVDVDGIDLAINYLFEETSFGEFSLQLSASHFLGYDVDVATGSFNAAGKSNPDSFVRSVPATKGNISLNWDMGAHNATAIVYYVDSYDNNRSAAPSPGFSDRVDSWTTLDVQYGYAFDVGQGEAAISLGVKNLFDEEPPLIDVFQQLSYDPKQHDARGRIFYAKAKYSF